MTITNSTISGNSASGNGGGIFSFGGTVTMANSILSNNSASGDGGGILSYGTLTLTNSLLSNNSALAMVVASATMAR
ncbi:MAG: hypothetical protein IPP66_23315 [Anaerolineales bacterium]|nr:hypothetical protein [Anaerolineales bacterium]